MAVGHQVAGGLPAPDVARGNGPGGAGQFPLARQKFLVNPRADDGEAVAPFLHVLEFFQGHLPCQEEILRLFAQALDHVLFRSVIFIARRDGVRVHFQDEKNSNISSISFTSVSL